MAPHEAVIGAQVGELLPGVAGHAREDRALAVHHLVMAERQDEVLGEGVEQAEGHLVVVPAAMGRVLAHIFQGVVHPPHVPLVAEAQAAGPGRLRHARPGGGFLGHGHGARMLAIGQLVHPAHEVDRFQVLAPAELVGHPLARLARIVEVEHRGHRIDPEPVDMVAVEPEQRVGVQVVGDLACGRNCRSGCSNPGGSPGAGPRARRGRCRRSGRGRARRSGNARAPSRAAGPGPPGGSGRRSGRSRAACRGGWWARTGRSAGSPRSRRTGAR